MENKFKLNKKERNWVLYDVANSAIVLFNTALMPIYYSLIATNAGYNEAQRTILFGTTISVAAFIIAMINPILGAIADNKGMKKKMFMFFLILGLVGCAIMGLSTNVIYAAVVLGMIQIGLNGSLVFSDAMLVDVTTESRMDKVSSSGYGFGYIGSCIPFVFALGLYMLPIFVPTLPFTSEQGVIFGLLLSGLWWFIMTLPLLKTYQQVHGVDPEPHQIRNAFKKIANTIRDAKTYKACFLFIVAYFFYINGVFTLISMSLTYAIQILGDDAIDSVLMIVALLMTQFVAFPFAIIYGKLADKYNPRWLIFSGIVGYGLICIAGYFLNSIPYFFGLAFFVGLFQGGIQALSRAYFGKIVPKEKATELFALFDLSGKGAGFLGPALFVGATAWFGSPRFGILALIVFFIIGGTILIKMPKTKADIPNKQFEKLQAEDGLEE